MTRGSGSSRDRRVRLAEVLRECWRDTVSGAGRAASGALVLGVLLGAVVGVRSSALAEDVRAAASFVSSGGATTVQRAEGRIDGRACDALSASEGIVASGALRRLDSGTDPAALPGSTVPTYEVTAGLPGLLSVSGSTGATGVVVSPEVGESLGLVPGDRLATTGGTSTSIAGVYEYPDDGRDPDLEYALLAPTADDATPFDACWVTVWPQRDDTVPMLRRTVLPTTGAEDEVRPTTRQLNPRMGERFMPSAGTPQEAALAAAFVVGAAVGVASVARRRLAMASDLHVGVPRSAQVLGIVLQHLLWGSVGAVVAVAVAGVVVRGLPAADALPIVRAAIGVASAGLVGSLLGGAVTAASVRERSLHRYFRSR